MENPVSEILKSDNPKAKRIILISAVLGIVGFLLYLSDRKQKAAAGGAAGGASGSMPFNGGALGSYFGANVSGDPALTEPQNPNFDKSFAFDLRMDTGTDFDAYGQWDKSGSNSGLNIGFGSGSFSTGGGSRTRGRSGMVSNQMRDSIELGFAGEGISESVLPGLIGDISRITGTYEQRMAAQTRRASENERLVRNFLGTEIVLPSETVPGRITRVSPIAG